MGEEFGKESTDIRQSAILIFSPICIAGLATKNKEEKYSSRKGNSRINYKYWSAKVIGSPEKANGGETRKCLT